MPPVYAQKQFGAVAGNVFEITGCLKDLARGCTSGTFGAHPDEVIQRHPIIGVFKDRGKGFQKSPGALVHVVILDMIADIKPLPLYYVWFLGRCKRLVTFLRCNASGFH
jgi:hypothetical protein